MFCYTEFAHLAKIHFGCVVQASLHLAACYLHHSSFSQSKTKVVSVVIHFMQLIRTEVAHFTQFVKVLLWQYYFSVCRFKMHALLPNESESVVLTWGTVMTASTNDTPLIEAPGAENMPNQWKPACYMVTGYDISWSKADRKLESSVQPLLAFAQFKKKNVLHFELCGGTPLAVYAAAVSWPHRTENQARRQICLHVHIFS